MMPDAPADLLVQAAAAWGLQLTAQQLDQFAVYATLLREWNKRTNLTAITSTDQIYLRHFLDSLVCTRCWPMPPQTLVDIGSGAGFPGLPLKLLYPALDVTLLESVGKKAAFLRHVTAALGLSQVTIVQARAEDLGRDPQQRERYDCVTARAVAEVRVLAEYGLPLLRIGGRLCAPKGAAADAELAAAANALALLGGDAGVCLPYRLPDATERQLVCVTKTGSTPSTYPRRSGVPARRPL